MSTNQNYNPDELEALEWLNTPFFTEVLIQYENAPDLKLNDLKLSPASAQGDHYASVMFRATVEYSTVEGNIFKSLIVKTMPEQGGLKKRLVDDSHMFQTEIAMYTEVLPKFEAILRDAGEECTLFVPCLYHSLKPRKVMILEDLVPQGYQVIRNRSATLDELRSALEKLAKWHAVSHKLLKEQPALFKELQYNISTLPNFLNQSFITNGLPNFIYMLDESEGLKKYKRYFEAMRGNLIQQWADTLGEYRNSPQKNSYYVLCHGDFHIRNLMFNNSSCMLLDFQLSHVGPLVNDFLYAMYMLFSADDRGMRRDELISYYLEVFANTLKKIGYRGIAPSFDEFQRQMIEKRHHEFLLLTTFLPMQIAARKNAVDPFRRRTSMYKDMDYQEEVAYLLERMNNLGYFKDMQNSI
ncbi:uncharacterized protein [Drosophila virilis]|uniref:Uncharacterized protein, isoform A n=1 Tax=Drosophila virilis TaxID=7244 RepID=B4LZL5_DROVI|nr:uncharacterized protein LOC6630636 [Drosophila virilis]EDW67154.1 uncharacterized protein Dvir_GJ24003, isoform A [Drosophila virilis]